jgi:N-acyl-D-amino-acid deacylase
MGEILFKNGIIVDGTGNPWFKADLVVAKGRIAAINQKLTFKADRVVDATGLVIAPGFIDLHTHSDRTIMTNNKASSSIMAGVTTEAVGNCGSSAYGFSRDSPELHSRASRVWGGMRDADFKWSTLAGYREKLAEKGIGVNIAPFVGHNTIRKSVMGPEGEGGEKITPSEAEMDAMTKFVEEAMNQAAFGITSGLRYTPGRNALAEEVIELCKIISEHGGVYMSHIRDSGRYLIEAVHEFIEICESADVRGCLSHNKAVQPQNWGKPCEVIRILENARSRGVDVICDMYPWNYSSAANLCRWFISGWGRNLGIEGHYQPSEICLETLLRDLRNPELWTRIKREAQERYDVEYANNETRLKMTDVYDIPPFEVINPRNFECITYSKTHPELVGKRFFEITETLGAEDHWEAIRSVLVDDDGHTFTGGGGICEEDIITILKFTACAISTDGSTRDVPSTVMKPAHPRNYGTFAKVLQHYVRETGVIPLEEAVRKMTSLPANFLGLHDRGILRLGMRADLTVFDHTTITNRATFAQPDRYPEGIEYVRVNGKMAAEKGERTNILSGQILHSQSSTS